MYPRRALLANLTCPNGPCSAKEPAPGCLSILQRPVIGSNLMTLMGASGKEPKLKVLEVFAALQM